MAAADAGLSKAPKSNRPPFQEMAKDAIESLGEKKGSSVQAILTFIAGKHNLDADFVRQHLKPALAKGLEKGTFIRPKGSDSKGFTGRFKLEDAKKKVVKESKAKEPVKDKKSTKAKVTKKTIGSTPKKSSKSPKKTAKATKSKSPGKVMAKGKATPKKAIPALKKAKATKPKQLKTPMKTPKRAKVTKNA